MCFSKRDWIVFAAGAEAFHTISHIFLSMSGSLPIVAFGITVTSQLNFWAIIINAVISVGLIYWACTEK